MNTANYIFGDSPYTIPSAKKIHVTYLFGESDGDVQVKTSKDIQREIERDFMNSGRDLLGLPRYHDDDDYENARDNELSWT